MLHDPLPSTLSCKPQQLLPTPAALRSPASALRGMHGPETLDLLPSQGLLPSVSSLRLYPAGLCRPRMLPKPPLLPHSHSPSPPIRRYEDSERAHVPPWRRPPPPRRLGDAAPRCLGACC
ncbi:hypothetical protein I4F81_001282 [Pyropia yezoensis]|uniref:Uncharacterized protein n=1 Tax=Pyropia yezoensis TaxID=2788 RepID=A0ACC3BMH3_PYRYE|nr:hypothetical protein I4F81_001282 [Neopyropia yezoensis]